MSVSRIDKYVENYNIKNDNGEIVNCNHTYYHINCPHCPITVLSKKGYRRFLKYELAGSLSRSLSSDSNTERADIHSHKHPTLSSDTPVAPPITLPPILKPQKLSTISADETNGKLPSTGNSWETISDDSHDEVISTSPLCEHEECYHAKKSYEIDLNEIITYTYFPLCKYRTPLSSASTSSSSLSSFSSVASYYSASSRFRPKGKTKLEYVSSQEVNANANRHIEPRIEKITDKASNIEFSFPPYIEPTSVDDTLDFFDHDGSSPFTDYDLSYDSKLGVCVHRGNDPTKPVRSHTPAAAFADLSFFAELLEDFESEVESQDNNEYEPESEARSASDTATKEPQSTFKFSSNVQNPISSIFKNQDDSTQIQNLDSSVNSVLDLTYDSASYTNSDIGSVVGIYSSTPPASPTMIMPYTQPLSINESFSDTQSHIPQSEILPNYDTANSNYTEGSSELPPMTSRVTNETTNYDMVSNSEILKDPYTQVQKNNILSDIESQDSNYDKIKSNESDTVNQVSEPIDSFGGSNNNAGSSVDCSNDNTKTEDRDNSGKDLGDSYVLVE
ncbi:unnamed protein product [[Candida] boidinii]|uniref:Unnamed protein product n=1 Tax=Candida boidinii TaxID=5477 RepID=A0A9W6T1V9_CANBO|nr:unnamed protein product [[Candida] boidinii]GMF98951.1 unnamed protein product [[Candida] boidinii]